MECCYIVMCQQTPLPQLYNDGGTLMFNGSAVGGGGGSVSGTPSGVAFFGDNGVLTDDPSFVIDSGGNSADVHVGINSDGAPDRTLVVGNTKYLGNAGFKLVNYAKGNALLEIVATSGGRTAGAKFSNGTERLVDWAFTKLSSGSWGKARYSKL